MAPGGDGVAAGRHASASGSTTLTGEVIEGGIVFGTIRKGSESGPIIAHVAIVTIDGKEYEGQGATRGDALAAAMQTAYPDKQIKWTPQAAMSPHLVTPDVSSA